LFITENLPVHGGMARKAKKAFLPHRYLNASMNIARRVMSSTGWGRGEPPNQQMRLEA